MAARPRNESSSRIREVSFLASLTTTPALKPNHEKLPFTDSSSLDPGSRVGKVLPRRLALCAFTMGPAESQRSQVFFSPEPLLMG